MKWILPCLLALAWSGAYCQSSPTPFITSFAGSSLPSVYSGPDSAFCKGGEITIAGGDFLSTNGGESFDSLSAWLGNVPAMITNVAVGDTLTVGLPDSFPNDTTLTLTVIKHTQFGSLSYQYGASATVRLLGDHAVIDYPPGPYCLGGANPSPSIQLGSGTTGGFCCWQSGGFSVLASGEIPLHSGALGIHSFLWAGTHPVCADTLSFTVQIDSMAQASAYVGGSTSIVVCENTSVLMADSVGLHPAGGLFDSPSGLALVDDSLGLVDIG